jgi:REP element-mobilizing transposase RayT
MPRPPRIAVEGASYHVTSRGNRRSRIFEDDDDRESFLDIVGEALEKLEARALAYCLMANHYHLLVRTAAPNLHKLMHRINGQHARIFNLRHAKSGHLFQGRYWAQPVATDGDLLEACRYLELNAVRAGLVASAMGWRWSSFHAHVGLLRAPSWLEVDFVHGLMLGRHPAGAEDRAAAAARYEAFVASANDLRPAPEPAP